jgi:hypothetical protein
MREFNTFGPCDPAHNYIVPRTTDIADFVQRLKKGRYIVIFAPRQTGKTTFFRWALEALTNEDDTYLPIQLNFEDYNELSSEEFYHCLKEDIIQEIDSYEPLQNNAALSQFLANYAMTSHVSMRKFFEKLTEYLKNRRVAIIIDEFDGIPPAEVKNFLHTLRKIYLSRKPNRCPYSLGIVGVKSITQLNYDRSISPFNIQDEFALSNFTLAQVQELLGQYTAEVGQAFAPEVIENLHKQTGGQPFLVNRMAQILTQEMKIEGTISNAHFHKAHQKILNEQNVHLSHLSTNIRSNPRFETLLMEICSYQTGVRFNIYNDFISELVTYGIVKAGVDGYCEITNPIYQYCIVQIFQPAINGLERKYLPEDTDDQNLGRQNFV